MAADVFETQSLQGKPKTAVLKLSGKGYKAWYYNDNDFDSWTLEGVLGNPGPRSHLRGRTCKDAFVLQVFFPAPPEGGIPFCTPLSSLGDRAEGPSSYELYSQGHPQDPQGDHRETAYDKNGHE